MTFSPLTVASAWLGSPAGVWAKAGVSAAQSEKASAALRTPAKGEMKTSHQVFLLLGGDAPKSGRPSGGGGRRAFLPEKAAGHKRPGIAGAKTLV